MQPSLGKVDLRGTPERMCGKCRRASLTGVAVQRGGLDAPERGLTISPYACDPGPGFIAPRCAHRGCGVQSASAAEVRPEFEPDGISASKIAAPPHRTAPAASARKGAPRAHG